MSGTIVLSNRCKPLAQWPRQDQEAWSAATAPTSQDLRHHGAGHWSAGTRRIVATGYGRWLTWLDQREPHAMADAPAARVTSGRVARYIEDLRTTVSLFTVAGRAEQLGHAMRAMAAGQNWHWLQQMAGALRIEARQGQTEKGAETTVKEPMVTGEQPGNRCLPLAEWPEQDRRAWITGLQPGDLLDPGGVAAGWAPTTQDLVRNGALVHGLEIGEISLPSYEGSGLTDRDGLGGSDHAIERADGDGDFALLACS